MATRPITVDDAEELHALILASREHLAPYEPERTTEFFTVAGQRRIIEGHLAMFDAGRMVPLVITDDAGRLAGRINLDNIVRGAFQSVYLGYWVGAGFLRQGLASAAVGDALHWAFVSLGLHRVQADVRVGNTASLAVLAKHGFIEYGRPERYLFLDGDWRDCLCHQLLSDDWHP
ncbi:MAG: GNAT family protein [Propionibacteriaceae bacterium]|nr:GNAT family N-acetyltransferase [Micropruina sp.]HBX82463.1 alanine acetyltransferase [Propionibacteriaceae bacterium]HBY23473.1 alanine acetyltransferase [Propionibacteriaceae bacterium]